MIPDRIKKAIFSHPLPLFIYDSMEFTQRAVILNGLVDQYYYPVKACPEKKMLTAALKAGAGLDLCSEGDVLLAQEVRRLGKQWSFTSAHVTPSLLQHLVEAGAVFDADSISQAMEWRELGGEVCGLRITTADGTSDYGIKFGIRASDIADAVAYLEQSGLRVSGLHIHESHINGSFDQISKRLISTLSEVDRWVLQKVQYFNMGGGWPIALSHNTFDAEIASFVEGLRKSLAGLGFSGRLVAEPGEWVAGPAGYWVARVTAMKEHPLSPNRRISILDTATPVPCRPSKAPFVAMGKEGHIKAVEDAPVWDLFGSNNTGADTIGLGVQMGDLQPGDIVIALCQGAYVRSLIGSFNEKPIPEVVIV